jgi:aspartyl-tRNA(Asn)/glutamyl-tRNA(Gln) amidotransferase subunit A
MVINLKDNIDLAGCVTTAASVILKDNVAQRNAFITDRLLDAGAVIIGKSNLHEWVFGPTSQSKHFGPVKNPWDPSRIPGGSSGGSGASVASEMCTVSIGSDTGGSIRIPSAFNGLAGLRPSVGRISCAGSVGVSPPFDVLGPLGKSVSDVARVFQVIAGYDPADPMSIDRPVPDALSTLNDSVRGKRIGFMRRWYFDHISKELQAAIDNALGVYKSLGVEIVEVDLGDVDRAHEMLGFRLILADAFEKHREQLAERPDDYGADIQMRLAIGGRLSGPDYAQALRWTEAWRHRLSGLFTQVDAMLCPTTPILPPLRADLEFAQAIRTIPKFTCVYAAAGVPSLALPCGFSAEGLPLSMELAGPAFGEAAILQLGHAFQQVTAHHQQRPTIFS